MKLFTLLSGATFGLISIILGAFGAHAFKKILPAEGLSSFETGVRYQMYGALFLLLVGYMFKFDSASEKSMSAMMVTGIVLFSFSIYFLAFQQQLGVNLRFLGPITPLGGLLMILSWCTLIYLILKR